MPEFSIASLLPMGHLAFVISQAGTGKSLVIESMVLSFICNAPFCGLKVRGGNVLLIDQDTPTNTLRRRLQNLKNGLGLKIKYDLYVESMKGYGMDDIPDLISGYSNIKYIFIDSLHSICHTSRKTGRGLRLNQTDDMQFLSDLKHMCLTPDRNIIITHHISEKSELTTEDLMYGPPNKLSMGSSVILQQADSYYILAATAEDGIMKYAYLRPVSKRESIPTGPFMMQMVRLDSNREYLEYGGVYQPDITDTQQDIMTLFEQVPEPLTVNEVYQKLGGAYGIHKVRKELKELDKMNKLSLNKHARNLFKYSKNGAEPEEENVEGPLRPVPAALQSLSHDTEFDHP